MNIAEFIVEHLWLLLPSLIALGLVIAGIRWLVQRAKIWWLVHQGLRTKSDLNTTPTTPSIVMVTLMMVGGTKVKMAQTHMTSNPKG